MILIYAPVTKACEPPSPLVLLSDILKRHGVEITLWDANYEAQNWLINKEVKNKMNQKEKRAIRNKKLLQNRSTYSSLEKYKRVTGELNSVLLSRSNGKVSLSDYRDNDLSPLSSQDLLKSAENFNENIFYDFFSERLSMLIEEKSPKVIGFSIQFLNQAICTFAIIGFIKKTWPNIKIAIGGGLITSFATKKEWTNPFSRIVDKIIPGRGIEELLDFLNVKFDKDIWDNRSVDMADLLDNSYFSPGLIVPYSSSEGCDWNRCTFCPEPAEGSKYSHQKKESLRKAIISIVEKWKPSVIHFTDNEMSPMLLKLLSQIKPDTTWYGFTRFYDILLDSDFCKLLAIAGCSMLKLGLESADDTVLNELNKGIKVQNVERILQNLSGAGIKTYVYIMFGTPSEKRESAEKTAKFISKNYQFIDYLNVSIFNLPLESKMAQTLECIPFYSGDLSLYSDFKHPEEWGRFEIRKWMNRSFKKDSNISKILNRVPPYFSSNHASLFSNCNNI